MECRDWVYFREGNANVVLKYQGKEKNYVGKVMRITKTDAKNRRYSPSEITEFRNDLIMPLFGEKYMRALGLVPVSKDFLESLKKQIEKDRPRYRRQKGEIAVDGLHVLIDHDYSIGKSNSFSCTIELKPKSGYIFPSDGMMFEDTRKKYCRYCMHQQLKFKSKEIESVSEYCPMKLYSNDKNQMKLALTCLMEKPQNNFFVFVPGQEGLTLNEIMTDMNRKNVFGNKENDSRDHLANILTEVLFRDGILTSLKYFQKKFDTCCISQIHSYYQKLDTNDRENVCKPFISTSNKFLFEDPQHENSETQSSNNFNTMVTRIQNFLISTSLRDCSIMIQLNLFGPDKKFIDTGLNTSIMFQYENRLCEAQISIVDVDPKHPSKIPVYFKLDDEIVRTFDSLTKKKMPCIS